MKNGRVSMKKQLKGIALCETLVLCPVCGNRTRIKVRHDTVLENFPLFCPKCKQETVISIKEQKVNIVQKMTNE